MNCKSLFSVVLVTLAFVATDQLPLRAANLEVVQGKGSVEVTVGGAPFATYVVRSNTKPIIWPIFGPSGDEVTRGFPMRGALPTENADHPHHRSFWFTHGDVNGTSYWHEGDNCGSIVHKEFVKVEGGEQATIVTRNDWVDPDGWIPCSDVRTMVFGANESTRWIDFDVTVTAGDAEVTFGDTKEGSFGVRVAGMVKVDAEEGGHIVNNQGDRDKETWGKRASWVDYHGPIGDNTVGIAILNHPSSLRFPTYWHVRTYGLFAANIFGVHNFTNNDDEELGELVLAPGR